MDTAQRRGPLLPALPVVLRGHEATATGPERGRGPGPGVVRGGQLRDRPAYPKLIYFNEVDRGCHFAAWQESALFSAELRAAFRSLR